MATSEQVNTSIARGSDEVINHNCVPCLSEDQHTTAKAFCVECEEYLCDTCLQCHKKTKVSKHHHLLIGENMDKQSVPKTAKLVFEKCATHADEVIKFYCIEHDVLGCSDCITLNHRTCDLDYLPDRCADIGQEYAEIMEKLADTLKSAKDVMKNAEDKDKRIEESHRAVWHKIHEFRCEIEDGLDGILDDTETNIYNMKLQNKLKVQDALSSCVELTSNMEKLQESLKENKTRRKLGELYITLRKAKSTLESEAIQRAERSLQCTNTYFSMESYYDFAKVFRTHSFGELREEHSVFFETPSLKTEGYLNSHKYEINCVEETYTDMVTPKLETEGNVNSLKYERNYVKEDFSDVETPATEIENNLNSLGYERNDVKELPTDDEPPAIETEDNLNWLKYKRNIYVRTDTDENLCDIIACAILSQFKVVLADWNNCKIKIVDSLKSTIIDEIFIGGPPYDVAVLFWGQIAVTIPFDNKVIFLNTSDGLEIYKSIPLQTECKGITYLNNFLYIVCLHPNRITVLDSNGLYKQTIQMGFDSLDRITPSLDQRFLYLTNFCENPSKSEVVRVTIHGNISKICANEHLLGPVGMVVLDDGSLLVCSINNRIIHYIDPDFKDGGMINDLVHNPTGISYNRLTGDVYVCQSQSNELKRFGIQSP